MHRHVLLVKIRGRLAYNHNSTLHITRYMTLIVIYGFKTVFGHSGLWLSGPTWKF